MNYCQQCGTQIEQRGNKPRLYCDYNCWAIHHAKRRVCVTCGKTSQQVRFSRNDKRCNKCKNEPNPDMREARKNAELMRKHWRVGVKVEEYEQ